MDRSLGIYASVVTGLEFFLKEVGQEPSSVERLCSSLTNFFVNSSIPSTVDALMGEGSSSEKFRYLKTDEETLRDALCGRIANFSLTELHNVIEFSEKEVFFTAAFLHEVIGKKQVPVLFPTGRSRNGSKPISKEFLRVGDRDKYWNKGIVHYYV